MKAGAEKCFADTKALTERAKELEKTLNHDVIGFTTAVAEKINAQCQPLAPFRPHQQRHCATPPSPCR